MEQKLYDLMDWAEIEAIVYSEQDHPENILGPRKVKGGILIQTFLPGAKMVFVKNKKDGKLYPMEEADEAGFYAVLIPGRKIMPYELIATYKNGEEVTLKDTYYYQVPLSKQELMSFEKGKHKEIYRLLGAHTMTQDGVKGTRFAVWAPNAMRVSVVGTFNRWDGRKHPMIRQSDSGVFSLFIPDVLEGELYKYEIKVNAVTTFLKSDPYGFRMELRPANASVVADLGQYQWKDAKWLEKRKTYDVKKQPMSVYEVHLGSWKKPLYYREDTLEAEWFNYRQIAQELAAYVKEMGYTHIELLPVMEHPLDESWGYQVTGYYAVTSRYGLPEDFMYFVDYMHSQGIGVLLDWVPAHFPKDENGLARFDGTCLYEHLDKRQGEHPHWGTLIYNYERPQVANFLMANALFWKEVYHIDGIRMDAVASMLYLDYGREEGQWIPNRDGGKENYGAVAFLQQLSDAFHEKKDGAVLIAEESTAWPMVTGETAENGLGFDLKWNMGWNHDFLQYLSVDPYFRKGSHQSLIFSMIYAYSEQFLLMFSHDDVVHEKGSMFDKMPGTPEDKLGNLRTAFGYMMTHPGKKLHFMGMEFAQKTEWCEKKSLSWELLEEPLHLGMANYVKDLNAFYRKHPALYDNDYDTSGFRWMSCMDADHSIVSFLRTDAAGTERLLVVCNFTPVLYENFTLGVPFAGKYKEIFSSDREYYGGTGCLNPRKLSSKAIGWDGQENSIKIKVPPLGIAIFQCEPLKETEKRAKK